LHHPLDRDLFIYFLLFIFLFIPLSLQKENLAKLHKRTIDYILGKKIIAVGKD